MRRIVSAQEMRSCDEIAIRSFGIPGLVLMENAGAGVARLVLERYHHLLSKHVAVVCGKGNNAGDGFVAARHLVNAGIEVQVLLLASPSQYKGDAKKNLDILRKLQRSDKRLRIRPFRSSLRTSAQPSVILDAIVGTGFSGTLRKPLSGAVEWINRQKVAVVAIDIPSGINGTTGIAESECVHASATATMGALKSGLLCNQGRQYSGRIDVVDIGMPGSIFRATKLRTAMVEREDIPPMIPARQATVHKYTAGKVFILAGSRGFTGAAALTASAALRAGAGAVILGTPETVYPILAKKLSEAIVKPLPATPEGTLSSRSLEAVMEGIRWADVTVLGPGLSQHDETVALVRRVLTAAGGKALVDADGLNACAGEPSLLTNPRLEMIITPHTGEFARLTGISAREIEARRIDAARSFSRKIRATVVLKGAPTVTASPDGLVLVNSTGNPGMATVGAGDVLAGIIAALWAQGATQFDAAAAGVYLHGLSGDLAAGKLGVHAVVAQDLIDNLPASFLSVQGTA